MAPTTVPNTKDTTASVRCTQKYAVGSPSSNASPLLSLTRFLTKVTQMIQLHTPKASRNQERRRLSVMRSVSPPGVLFRDRGGEGSATSRRGPGTFCVVPAPMKPTVRRSLLVTSATLAALALTAPVSLAVPIPPPAAPRPPSASPSASASASPSAGASKGASASASPSVTPPAKMSTVGGTRLGQAGTQVTIAGGAPVLPKDLTARSWIVADAESGDVLAAHNAHWRLPPASTLKMLFADTVLPRFPRTTAHKVDPKDLAGIGAGSSLVGIKEGETYTVHDLWLGVFLRSGNDAVHVLSAMNGGVAATVAQMNAHADELQALDTDVVSPDGYDAPGQVSSAYDLTLFARSGLQKKDFREYCSTVSAKFPGATTKNKKGKPSRGTFEIQNTNRLLSGDYDISQYPGIAGVKNGNTTNAGATFTGVAERNGKVLLVTVMNPEKSDHNEVYKETAALFDWGFQAAGKVTPVGELVAPRDAAQPSAQPGANPSSSAGAGQAGGAAGNASGKPVAGAVADDGSGGMWIALAITGGLLVLLAGGAWLVNRRWPLPDLVRRRR
ncbi:D-alanyl-D-alanine carboxypeptidase (penicillin-binding protein 5/6) [Streptomyces achromogenes]|uniref:D-alanyl-D-alanine carboxypeptidase (Penicillin-binding protein 5/6) n=1 Tax=Streptomyces achromogenes TaxID=67255 RepID=A0ABU0Q5C8_STRAH|nr:D-alanyl-D-alanine carboxypeptidase (penicillin-binding protein 5/6) [Streptomyces achromogenes]MDQ0832989.1 D-alanyl-D-alanine carboxypeptidase (penicillin-binding protein 5/6) [Streptomyces achromogenes]